MLLTKLSKTLREKLQLEESESVGSAFGGTGQKRVFSVPAVRDALLSALDLAPTENLKTVIKDLKAKLSAGIFTKTISALIRFSFIIELTNLTVGSTKMKTRWQPGKILMPQAGSFEPVPGVFKPGNDPRSASFMDCLEVFIKACKDVSRRLDADAMLESKLSLLFKHSRVPYEFPLSYKDAAAMPVHTAANTRWAFNDDIEWLLYARKLLSEKPTGDDKTALREIEKTKIKVKVFKTDRALTGKDKTNRARRWEVLADDFQHASLEQCWSAERKLTVDLIKFEGFPDYLAESFVSGSLVDADQEVTRCPVTLSPLRYLELSAAILDPQHGVSQYQVGHLHPLKRGGPHDGANVCWQSADGNRIQGDLSIEETERLLEEISIRRSGLGGSIGEPQ